MKYLLFIKAFIYRVYSSLITSVIAFIVTGNFALSLALGGIDVLVKIFSYSLFDYCWQKVVYNYKPSVIWLTGLPCAGKTTIAYALSDKLKLVGVKTIILDGDEIRDFFKIGFDKESRIAHNIDVGKLASLFEKQGFIVIVSLVSPYKEARDESRKMSRRFFEVYVSASVDVCKGRDVKGMYAKAIAGEIKGFTGIDAPYEAPISPELVLDTSKLAVAKCVKKIMATI